MCGRVAERTSASKGLELQCIRLADMHMCKHARGPVACVQACKHACQRTWAAATCVDGSCHICGRKSDAGCTGVSKGMELQ